MRSSRSPGAGSIAAGRPVSRSQGCGRVTPLSKSGFHCGCGTSAAPVSTIWVIPFPQSGLHRGYHCAPATGQICTCHPALRERAPLWLRHVVDLRNAMLRHPALHERAPLRQRVGCNARLDADASARSPRAGFIAVPSPSWSHAQSEAGCTNACAEVRRSDHRHGDGEPLQRRHLQLRHPARARGRRAKGKLRPAGGRCPRACLPGLAQGARDRRASGGTHGSALGSSGKASNTPLSSRSQRARLRSTHTRADPSTPPGLGLSSDLLSGRERFCDSPPGRTATARC